MTTGTIVMIVCAVLYGLIVILFKNEGLNEDLPDYEDSDLEGADGLPGIPGLLIDDVGVFKKPR